MIMQTRKRRRHEAVAVEKEAVNVRVDIMARLQHRLLQEVQGGQSVHPVEHMKYFQLCEEIMTNLDVRTLNALAGVSKKWREISESGRFWTMMCAKKGICNGAIDFCDLTNEFRSEKLHGHNDWPTSRSACAPKRGICYGAIEVARVLLIPPLPSSATPDTKWPSAYARIHSVCKPKAIHLRYERFVWNWRQGREQLKRAVRKSSRQHQ
ncbi:unnamed protein product [Sphagnum balticum]